jgi:hypothetical protein
MTNHTQNMTTEMQNLPGGAQHQPGAPDVNRINLEPMIRRQPDNWRSELVPEDVREMVARHYSPDMNPFDGGALLWYARNRLFFDLNLADEERVLARKYEDLSPSQSAQCEGSMRSQGSPFPGDASSRTYTRAPSASDGSSSFLLRSS